MPAIRPRFIVQVQIIVDEAVANLQTPQRCNPLHFVAVHDEIFLHLLLPVLVHGVSEALDHRAEVQNVVLELG